MACLDFVDRAAVSEPPLATKWSLRQALLLVFAASIGLWATALVAVIKIF